MQLPRDERLKLAVTKYLRSQANVDGFQAFMQWVRLELQEKDEQNRMTGFENTTSEALCLAQFIQIVAACQAPEVDRDTNISSGAESRSAALCM